MKLPYILLQFVFEDVDIKLSTTKTSAERIPSWLVLQALTVPGSAVRWPPRVLKPFLGILGQRLLLQPAVVVLDLFSITGRHAEDDRTWIWNLLHAKHVLSPPKLRLTFPPLLKSASFLNVKGAVFC